MFLTRFITRSLTRSLLTTFNPSLRRLLPLSAAPTLAPAGGARWWCSIFPFEPLPPPPAAGEEVVDTEYSRDSLILEGCDFEHWLVVMEDPEGEPDRDQIITQYIKIAAIAIGSEEEARMKMYSVSTKHFYAFGAQMSSEQADKLNEIPGVLWVLPDSYLDVENKDYGGEPFINGQAVPYDPKYHEEWLKNNAAQNERMKSGLGPDEYYESPEGPPFTRKVNTKDSGSNIAGGSQENMRPNIGGGPQRNMWPNMSRGQQGNMGPNMAGWSPMGMSAPPNMVGVPPWSGGMQLNNMGNPPNYNSGPPMGGIPPQYDGMQPNDMWNPPNYYAGSNVGGPMIGGGAPPNMGGMPPQYGIMQPNDMENPLNHNAGPNMGEYPNNQHDFNYGNGPINGGMPDQSGPTPNQDNFAPNNGDPYYYHNYPGRDYQ